MDNFSIYEKCKSVEQFKCTKNEFISQSEQGLKTHTTIGTGGYPKSCDVCECEITSAAMMKIHLKSHSFKEAKFQCEDCEFVG